MSTQAGLPRPRDGLSRPRRARRRRYHGVGYTYVQSRSGRRRRSRTALHRELTEGTAQVDMMTKTRQLRLVRLSPAYWRVTIDTPPINVMGPPMVREFQDL